jgi:hypothetical protein
MGELLKAVLKEQSISATPVMYTAESGFLTADSVPTYDAPNPLTITCQNNTYFLVERYGFTIAQSDETGKVRVLTDIAPYLHELVNPITNRKYFSDAIATNDLGLPVNMVNPCINDNFDLEEYILMGPLDQLSIVISVNNSVAEPPQDFGAWFQGTEFKFNQPIDIATVKAQALAYMPPAIDTTRAFSIDPMGAVTPSSSKPLTPAPNVPQANAALQALFQQQQYLSQLPANPETTQQLRQIRHQITQIQAMIQAANAKTS